MGCVSSSTTPLHSSTTSLSHKNTTAHKQEPKLTRSATSPEADQRPRLLEGNPLARSSTLSVHISSKGTNSEARELERSRSDSTRVFLAHPRSQHLHGLDVLDAVTEQGSEAASPVPTNARRRRGSISKKVSATHSDSLPVVSSPESEPSTSFVRARRSSKYLSLSIPHAISTDLVPTPRSAPMAPSSPSPAPMGSPTLSAAALAREWRKLIPDNDDDNDDADDDADPESPLLARRRSPQFSFLPSPVLGRPRPRAVHNLFRRSASADPDHSPLSPEPSARRRRLRRSSTLAGRSPPPASRPRRHTAVVGGSPSSRRRLLGRFGSSQDACFSDVASYLPTVVIQEFMGQDRSLASSTSPTMSQVARTIPFEAAVAFVDMSGFTRLTEHFQKTDGGVEAMSRVLNNYFAQLIDVIYYHGGDVIKFAGDALLLMWSSACSKKPQPLAVHTLHAAVCLQDLHTKFCDFEAIPGITLSLHSALGAGMVIGAHVGGVGGRWEFILDSHEHSPALNNLWAAMDHAKLGDIVLSADAYALLDEQPLCTLETEIVFESDDCYRMLSLEAREMPAPVPLARIPVGNNAIADRLIPKTVTQRLRAYVPSYVSTRLDQKQISWLAELRALTVVFIKLPSFSLSKPGELEVFQQLIGQIMRICAAQLGMVRQIITDDKGTVVILVFGMASATDGALRGVRAALLIRRSQSMSTRPIFLGVSTGDLFCGNLGSTRRREFVFMGDAVNTAARLMCLGAKNHAAATNKHSNCTIVCDDRTRSMVIKASEVLSEPSGWFTSIGEVQLKGKQDLVKVWRPRFAILGTDLALFEPLPRAHDRFELVVKLLEPQLAFLDSDAAPDLLLVTDMPTHSLNVYVTSHLYHTAVRNQVLVITSSAPSSETSSTGFVIGRLIMQCLWHILADNDSSCGTLTCDCSTMAPAPQRQHQQLSADLFPIVEELADFMGTHRYFRKHGKLPRFTKDSPLPLPATLLVNLALLNGIVPGLALPVDAALSTLSSQQREQAIATLIGQVFCFAACTLAGRASPMQVIVNNAEHIDAFSITVLLECMRRHHTVRVALCAGGMPSTERPLVHALQHVRLEQLCCEHTNADMPSWLTHRPQSTSPFSIYRRLDATPIMPMRSVSGRRRHISKLSPTSSVASLPGATRAIRGGVLVLAPLDREDVRCVLSQQLHVEHVDPRVVELCLFDSSGALDNLLPLIDEQVASGNIVVNAAASSCYLREDKFEAYGMPIPAYVSLVDSKHIVLSADVRRRVDAFLHTLGPAHLMVLKSASVIGNYFTQELITQVFPVGDAHQRSRVPEILAELTAAGVLQKHNLDIVVEDQPHGRTAWAVAAEALQGVDKASCFAFVDRPTQRILYERLPREYRAKLHAKVAACLVELLEQLPAVVRAASQLWLRRLATFHWSHTPLQSSANSDLLDAASCAALSTANDLVHEHDLDLAVEATWSGRYVRID